MSREDSERMRIPPDDLIVLWADTITRLLCEGFTDEEVDELWQVMRNPNRGPCERMFTDIGEFFWFPDTGQELV